MTDFSPSDDELLSSFIDGDLTGDARARLVARLAEEAPLQRRLEALQEAAALAATPVPALSAEAGEALIAAALAASPTSAAVTDLAAARTSRATRWLPRMAVGAAAVAVLAIAVPAVVDQGDDDADVAGDAAEETTALTEGDMAESDAADTATRDADTLEALADQTSPAESNAAFAMGDDAFDDGSTDDAAGGDATDGFADDGADGSDGGSDNSVDIDSIVSWNTFLQAYGRDPLEGAFGPFADPAELRVEVSERLDSFYSADGAGLNEPEADALALDPSARAALLDAAGLSSCGPTIEEAERALARAPTATSSASVAVGGEPRAVVLYALDDSTVIAFVLDPVACEIVDSVELNPGG